MRKTNLKLLSLILAFCLAFAFACSCGGGDQSQNPSESKSDSEVTSETTSESGNDSESGNLPKPDAEYGNYAELDKISSFDGAIQADKWSTTVARYTVIENGFLTIHPGTTEVTLKDYNFENGTLEFQIKPDMKGDAICIVFCNQNNVYDEMNYSAGMKNYTIAINSEGAVELVKYCGLASPDDEGHAKKLQVSENKADSLLSGADFIKCKLELKTDETSAEIKFSVGKIVAGKLKYTEYIGYTDTDSPYKGGRFAFSAMNGSGLAVADAETDVSAYVAPPLPPFEPIEVTEVPEYKGEETLTLFAGATTKEQTLANFADGFSGRNGIFNYSASEQTHNGKYGVKLNPALNAEENGMIEFVGHYNKYVFGQVMYEITFSIDKMDAGWVMFWWKNMSKTQNVSAWGNKFTREGTHCYMNYLTASGDLFFNKWVDWQQFFLGSNKKIKNKIDPQDIGVVHTIRLYTEYAKVNPDSAEEFDSVTLTYAYVNPNGSETVLRTYQDTKTALLNPGYFGMQTFGGAIMTVYGISATVLD